MPEGDSIQLMEQKQL